MFFRIAEYMGREGWPNGTFGSSSEGLVGDAGEGTGIKGALNRVRDGFRGSFVALPLCGKEIGRDSIAFRLREQDDFCLMTDMRCVLRRVFVGEGELFEVLETLVFVV